MFHAASSYHAKTLLKHTHTHTDSSHIKLSKHTECVLSEENVELPRAVILVQGEVLNSKCLGPGLSSLPFMASDVGFGTFGFEVAVL